MKKRGTPYIPRNRSDAEGVAAIPCFENARGFKRQEGEGRAQDMEKRR